MPTEDIKTPEAGADPALDKVQEQVQQEEIENFDKDRALETIRKQRDSEKKLAGQLKEAKSLLEKFQTEEAKRKEAELSELDKAKKQVSEMEAALKEAQTMAQALKLQQSFRSTAAKLKFSFASEQAEEDAFELADMSEVQIDANGKVIGLEDAIKELQKSRPYLFASAEEKAGGPGTPNRPKQPANNGQSAKSIGPKINF